MWSSSLICFAVLLIHTMSPFPLDIRFFVDLNDCQTVELPEFPSILFVAVGRVRPVGNCIASIFGEYITSCFMVWIVMCKINQTSKFERKIIRTDSAKLKHKHPMTDSIITETIKLAGSGPSVILIAISVRDLVCAIKLETRPHRCRTPNWFLPQAPCTKCKPPHCKGVGRQHMFHHTCKVKDVTHQSNVNHTCLANSHRHWRNWVVGLAKFRIATITIVIGRYIMRKRTNPLLSKPPEGTVLPEITRQQTSVLHPRIEMTAQSGIYVSIGFAEGWATKIFPLSAYQHHSNPHFKIDLQTARYRTSS